MKYFFPTILLFFLSTINICAQDVFGKWKTVDENTGEQKSIIEIYKKGDKVFGKVLEILNPEKKDEVCTLCEGSDKGKPIEGLVIMKNLEKDGDEYDGGEITDPTSGKTYSCYISLEEKNKLKVRGYLGFALLGRTQYWIRVD